MGCMVIIVTRRFDVMSCPPLCASVTRALQSITGRTGLKIPRRLRWFWGCPLGNKIPGKPRARPFSFNTLMNSLASGLVQSISAGSISS